MHAYFDQIEKVRFEGQGSRNPFAFRHYNPDEVILGKRMADHLRFAVCYWHTFCWNGTDMFGAGAFARPGSSPATHWRWRNARPISPSNSCTNWARPITVSTMSTSRRKGGRCRNT